MGLAKGLKAVYREGGVRALYYGYAITLARAFPANAMIFSVYEATSKVWRYTFDNDDAREDRGGETVADDHVGHILPVR